MENFERIEKLIWKHGYSAVSNKVRGFLKSAQSLDMTKYQLLFDLTETYQDARRILIQLEKMKLDNIPESMYIRACWKTQNGNDRSQAINIYRRIFSENVSSERFDNPVMIRYEHVARERAMIKLGGKYASGHEEISHEVVKPESDSADSRSFDKIVISKSFYRRSEAVRKKTLENSNYLCEINSNHKTFIAASTNKNFVESHHLIPLEYQHLYEQNLDVVANTVALCPGCHRMLHFGRFADKKKSLAKLYKLKEAALRLQKINVSIEDLYFKYTKNLITEEEEYFE